MTGLGCGNRCTDRLLITHLTDEDNIRILTKCGTDTVRKRKGIKSDLSLVNNGVLMLMKVLDRVLQSNDMLFTILIDHIDQGCQCRRLTGSGRSCNQYETTLSLGEIHNRPRKSQLLRCRDHGIDQTKNCRKGVLLTEYITTETSQCFCTIREIRLTISLQCSNLSLIHNRKNKRLCIVRCQHMRNNILNRTVDTHLRRKPYRNMYIGCSYISGNFQQTVHCDFHFVNPPYS